MRYKALIFDYGGTLDSPGIHWSQLLWSVYRKFQIPISEQEFREAYVHVERTLGRDNIIMPAYTFHKTLAVKLQMQMDYLQHSHHDNTAFQKSVARLPDMIEMLYTNTQRIIERNRVVLATLRKKYPLALVSNFYGNLGTVLREFSLEGFFSHVVESAKVNMRKPDLAIFQLCVNRLGFAPHETLVIGDSIKNDILPARSIGCHTAWLTPQADEEHTAIPDIIINNLDQLLSKHIL